MNKEIITIDYCQPMDSFAKHIGIYAKKIKTFLLNTYNVCRLHLAGRNNTRDAKAVFQDSILQLINIVSCNNDTHSMYVEDGVIFFYEFKEWITMKNALDLFDIPYISGQKSFQTYYIQLSHGLSLMDTIFNKRVYAVQKKLHVGSADAARIVNHLTKNKCLDWIDRCDVSSMLTDVHIEPDFPSMINWKYHNSHPSDMLKKSSDIGDYNEMLQLSDKVILWHGLLANA